MFPVILTDNGTEFSDPTAIECDGNGNTRTKIFYCDPNCSFQKGMIEKNHEFIRYIIPKGKSFDCLSPQKVNLMINHINSLSRDSLNSHCPFDMANLLLPKDVLELLSLHKIKSDDVLLKPALLK